MNYKEFVDSISPETPENILFYVSNEKLKDYVPRLVHNAQAKMILENGVVESVYFTDKCLMLIIRRGERFFQIDMCDGFGVTLAEILPTEKIDFWSIDFKSGGKFK